MVSAYGVHLSDRLIQLKLNAAELKVAKTSNTQPRLNAVLACPHVYQMEPSV